MPPMTSDPRRHYKAYGSALDFWRDRSGEVVLSGPAGTGKSRACLEKLHACCLKWPGTRALIVRKTRESLKETALVTYEAKVLPEGSPIAEGANRQNRQVYLYPNGSAAVVAGLDKPSKIMSTEFDIAYVQEATELSEPDWESITTRLRNGVMPFQQVIGDCNPDAPTHWLKRRADQGRCVMYESRHEDNPTLYDHARDAWTDAGGKYLAKLDALTGVRKPRLRYGKWVAAEGAVYEGFDRSIHLIDRFPIPVHWRRIRSIDFGYTNPFVCQFWCIDYDGRMYLYREIYRTRRTVARHVPQIERYSGTDHFEATVADHDAEDRATLSEEGIETDPAWKAITPGIQAVQERLVVQADGKPRLFVFRDALVERDELLDEAKLPACTLDEFDAYTYPKGQDGKTNREQPVDAYNHGMDAMRYAVAYVDELGYGRGSWGPNPFAGRRA